MRVPLPCRRLFSALSLLGLTLLLTVVAPAARAGMYELRACLHSTPLFFEGRWEQYLNGRVDVVRNCDRQAGGWVGIYQSRRGNPFAAGEGAGYRWYAPAGADFIGSRVNGKLRNANGIAAQIYATNPYDGYYSLDAGQSHDGVERQLYVDFSNAPRSQVAMRLACLTKPPCSNRPNDVKAFFEFREIRLQLRDNGAPSVQAGGDLFTGSGRIYRNLVSFNYSASDNGSGLWRAFAEVNGTSVSLTAFSCPGAHSGFADRTQPCPTSANRQGTFDTSRAPFNEGANQIRICAQDYATAGSSNVGCSGWRSFVVDNVAPGPPQSLTVVDGADWRADNEFALSWQNPPAGTTPLVAIRYLIEDAATGQIIQPAREITGDGLRSLTGLKVPWPGHFRVHLQLRDAAGNLGPAASASLRFDNLRPGRPGAASPPRWLAAGDFPFELELRPPESLGPSGLAGYAFTLEPEGDLCEGERCPRELISRLSLGKPVIRIERLTEGVHRLRAVAVSGAWMRSAEERQVELKVDLTEPETRLLGAPADWARAPVTLTALARDEKSGMTPLPASAHLPQTVIEIPGMKSWVQIGERVTTTLDRQGIHEDRHWARDVAGNTNDGRRLANGHRYGPPGRATVRLDWTPPRVEFLPIDPGYPERIRVRITDRHSGPGGGTISYRPAGSSEPPVRLPTRYRDGLLVADFPSDDVPDGYYEFSATGLDRAGNSSTDAGPGGSIVLAVPMKSPSSVTLRFAERPRSTRRIVRHSSGVPVAGRLIDQAGSPLARAPVELIERFRSGARIAERITVLHSDPDGRFRIRLKAGPAREVRARFPGGRLLTRSESAPLHLAVRAAVTLRLKPVLARNGETVRMRGRVRGRGAAIPAKGKLVAIQYLDPTRRRWRPVELIRTGKKGRFRYGYRFNTVVNPQRFLLRAVAVPEAGWPYLAAATPGHAVVVYPR